jgi:predicted metal-dependent hydrolase
MMTAPSSPWNGTVPRTRLFDALSLLLPSGERFVIATLEEWRSAARARIPSSLHAEVDRFIREERAHQRAHTRYNATILASAPGAEAPARRAAAAADELATLSLRTRLALCAAFELLTAVVSRELLERPFLLHAAQGSVQERLWRWHAKEELAHCHVALQAAEWGGVGRASRALALCLATAYLAFDVAVCAVRLARCDIAAGVTLRRVLADSLSMAVHGLPSLGRMAIGWLRCAAGADASAAPRPPLTRARRRPPSAPPAP